jgi:uncharacterized OB-fold protein
VEQRIVDMTDRKTDLIRPERDYKRFLDEGKFMILRSRTTGNCIFYPRVAEPVTGSTDLEWVPASGSGIVYSTSVMRERTPKESYNVALIDLEEGPRMMSRVEGLPPEDVKIGMRVKAKIIKENGQPLVVFSPA